MEFTPSRQNHPNAKIRRKGHELLRHPTGEEAKQGASAESATNQEYLDLSAITPQWTNALVVPVVEEVLLAVGVEVRAHRTLVCPVGNFRTIKLSRGHVEVGGEDHTAVRAPQIQASGCSRDTQTVTSNQANRHITAPMLFCKDIQIGVIRCASSPVAVGSAYGRLSANRRDSPKVKRLRRRRCRHRW